MNKIMQKVSVIIPTYNASEFIERCLESVFNQSYKNIEIIIVDDGSTDLTLMKVGIYGKQVRIFQNETNQGPAYSRTKGLFECRGHYVAFLDVDDYWDKDFVSATVAFLETHSEVVAVSTGYIGIDLQGRASIEKPNLDLKDLDFYSLEGKICPDFFDFWSHYFCVLTGTVMMRTLIARKTKGQRKELRLTEDLEFWGYISTFGQWGFIPQALFITDPGIITPQERLKKMQKRYEFFASLEIKEWSKRIESRISEEQGESFEKIINHIKTTIVIANAYTLRYKESYRLVKIWKDDLEAGLGGVLKTGHSWGSWVWPGICFSLRVRECIKSYSSYTVRIIKLLTHKLCR